MSSFSRSRGSTGQVECSQALESQSALNKCGQAFRSSRSLAGEICGYSFCEMVMLLNDGLYASLLGVETDFDVIVVHGQCSQLHWLLLINMKGATMPYLSIEITTSNLKDLIPTMRTFSNEDIKTRFSKHMDEKSWKGKLGTLCNKADSVIKEMEEYNLLTSNCQHFCNNLLKKLGLDVFPTTVGPKTTLTGVEETTDQITVLLSHFYSAMSNWAPESVRKSLATTMDGIVGAPTAHHN